MRIAVIGSGIAGNAAAWALTTSSGHDVTVYERASRLGGHSATVDVDYDGHPIAVDTGFIVYNELNYPNLTQLFAHLGVETEASDMSFSVSARGGAFEWSGRTDNVLDGLFARRRNIVSPGYLRMLGEMFRFNRRAILDRAAGRLASLSLGDYLAREGYSNRFRDDYLVPMGAAIWSTPAEQMLRFPAESFVNFFENHRLLHWNRPVWRTVKGGSRNYVSKLTAAFAHKVRLACGATRITRDDFGVTVEDAGGGCERYDQVVIAAHSDEALALLGDASPHEQAVLGAIGYRPNDVWLHRDASLMPRRKAAWAAWNVRRSQDVDAEICVTYWMNALQPSIERRHPLFVTLNPPEPPRADLVFGRYNYAHPQYDGPALAAQLEVPALQGERRTWFCGAWTGYGFHEDGLASGLRVAESLGAVVPWRLSDRRLVAAAE
jgi:predicted NAD/FAD-binding protein